MRDKLPASRIVQCFGFNPANRKESMLNDKGIESVSCDACSGAGSHAGGRCGVCGGTGKLFMYIESTPTTW